MIDPTFIEISKAHNWELKVVQGVPYVKRCTQRGEEQIRLTNPVAVYIATNEGIPIDELNSRFATFRIKRLYYCHKNRYGVGGYIIDTVHLPKF